MTYGNISCCLAKERTPEGVDIRSKYPNKHSVTLVKNKDFLFGGGLVLASLRLVI